MKLRGSFFGPVVLVVCVHCMPDFDVLSQDYRPPHGGASGNVSGAGGTGGSGQAQGGTSTGGRANGGRGGSAGKAGRGKGGSTGGMGVAGTGVVTEGGQSGANEGGEGGALGGAAGEGGATTGGTTSTGGMATGGTMNEAGMGGASQCDGCGVILYIPPTATFAQFFTINLDLANGVDLSNAVITAHVEAVDFTGTTENIQLYASALPSYNYWGNNNVQVALSTLTSGGDLTMDLTSTGSWDNTKVMSFGFLLHGPASPTTTVQVKVDSITVAVKGDPTATANAGPWFFTHASDVDGDEAQTVDTMYSTPNVMFANPYMAATGAKAIWVGPGG